MLLLVVVLGLGPGLIWRTPIGARSNGAAISVIPIAKRAGVAGALRLSGAWELRSDHAWFGGFSALVAGDEGGLIAGSDRGWLLAIDLSGPAPRPVPDSFRFVGRRVSARDEVLDLEALARDPASGTLWAGFERFNQIERFAPDGTRALRAPPELARWRRNSGVEAMERLADGRFLVIAEGSERGGKPLHRALLFARDPVEPQAPRTFRFVSWPGYDPVDMTQLPDGRVLILLRRVEYALPARFDTAIAIADPAAIRAGQAWRGRIIQRLAGGVFADNFEGIAFVPDAADPSRGAVWVIADDNFSAFQKSVLVRFEWEG
ncbi:MAG: esterase-like activity of phytase family protein [Erythrobacter sp.]